MLVLSNYLRNVCDLLMKDYMYWYLSLLIGGYFVVGMR